MNEIMNLIKDLKTMEDVLLKAARAERDGDKRLSCCLYLDSATCQKAAEELKGRIPIPAEIEGGDKSYFYVCGECHGNIGSLDKFCRHCGHPIDWSGKP